MFVQALRSALTRLFLVTLCTKKYTRSGIWELLVVTSSMLYAFCNQDASSLSGEKKKPINIQIENSKTTSDAREKKVTIWKL